MAQPVIQTSFNAGEWAPALNARVDLTKYHSGAALLRNWFVDYRGGATCRAGTKYILQAYKSGFPVRLIPFQASFTVSYMLEFGQNYIRFYNDGAPVLETSKAVLGITQANPAVVNVTAHGYSDDDWVFISGVGGMIQVNGNYYSVTVIDADHFSLSDLNGVPINSTTYTAYTAGGIVQRVYTLDSPYTGAQLAQIKFAQNVDTMVICHPDFPPYLLSLVTATHWTLVPIVFGSTVLAPASVAVATTLAAGSVNYAYVVTAVDSSGQESPISAFATLASKTDLRTVAGTNTVSWSFVNGAASYNVYKAEPSYAGAIPAGSAFGFAGNVTGTDLIDSNISPDFSQGPPVVQNPFAGSGVSSVAVTSPGTYNGGDPVPSVTFSGGGGTGATAIAALGVTGTSVVSGGGAYNIGDNLTVPGGGGAVLTVATIGGLGDILTVTITNPGSLSSGFTPSNPVIFPTFPGGGGAQIDLTWGVVDVNIASPGVNYVTAPAVLFSNGGAAATSTLGAASSGNPTVPGFFQQRLVLAGPVASPQQFNMSQTGAFYNFDIHNPIEASDAIQGTLVSGQLNTIKSLIPQPQGLIILSDKQAWLLNGGSPGSVVSPASLVANSQAYNGASDPPPIVANDNVLYVQSKGSIVRDLVFNFYTQVYTGTDISVLSSHLFYGFTILEWAWCEEPFKVVWAVRDDGTLLSLTFLKEQELIAWAHSDTEGTFKSVATITEAVDSGAVDALYTVVERTINGNTIKYIERMAELFYPNGLTDAWAVDSGLQYNGTSTLTFRGAQHLAGATVTGLATDNLGNVTIITPFAMPVTGTFTLPAPTAPATGYTRITIGLAYLPQLQTLQLDTGEPTIQGKMKSIPAVTVRVNETLGLEIGKTFDTLVPMKDLVRGNVGSATNELVTGLVTGDAMTRLDPSWTVPGQYCIQQSSPFPASILGIIPQIEVGDTARGPTK